MTCSRASRVPVSRARSDDCCEARRRRRRPLVIRPRCRSRPASAWTRPKVHVIPHGAFEHLTRQPVPTGCLPSWPAAPRPPVVLFFGLVRPYKGVDVLLRAWRGAPDAELWVVGRAMIDSTTPRAAAAASASSPGSSPTRERGAVSTAPTSSCCPMPDPALRPVGGAGDRARVRQRRWWLSDIGGFPRDRGDRRRRGLSRRGRRGRGGADGAARRAAAARADGAAARAAAAGPYSWRDAAAATLASTGASP